MMKIVQVRRKTAYEKRYSPKMGELSAKTTYIRKYVLGIPVKTLYKYREWDNPYHQNLITKREVSDIKCWS